MLSFFTCVLRYSWCRISQIILVYKLPSFQLTIVKPQILSGWFHGGKLPNILLSIFYHEGQPLRRLKRFKFYLNTVDILMEFEEVVYFSTYAYPPYSISDLRQIRYTSHLIYQHVVLQLRYGLVAAALGRLTCPSCSARPPEIVLTYPNLTLK